MIVSAVILAAGRSSRFEDGHKLLVEIGGVPLIRHVCLTLAYANVTDIVLITAEAGGAVAKAAGLGRWRIVENTDARDGLSTSLRTGLENVANDADGLLVALADMPGFTTSIVNTLIAAFSSNQDSIVFPASSDGRRGHPIIWPKSLFRELETISGDTGGKSVLAAHPERWLPVACEDEGAFADIDTRADLDAFTATDQTTRRK